MTGECTNLGDIFGFRHDSDDTALVDIDRDGGRAVYSFAHLEYGARAVAEQLSALSLGNGARVAILASNSAFYLMAYLGILRSGCVCVPINKHLPAETIDFIIEDAQIEFAITDDEGATMIPDGMKSARLDCISSTQTGHSAPTNGGDDAALILYTSGSTGRPKGVVLSHRSQLAMVDAIGGRADSMIFRDRKGIVAAPMFHMNALVFIAVFLKCGGSIVLMARFDPHLFAKAIENYQVDVLTGVPPMIAILHSASIRQPLADLSSISTVYIGSAPLSDSVIEQSKQLMPKAAVLNSYGTTETGGGLFGPHPGQLTRPARSVGYPMPHVELKMDGNGELLVRAPSQMTEYLNMPDQTAEKFADGWYHTGDIFEVDENGFYFFVGRVDDMFVCSGENIYPGEVEQIIERHVDVEQAVVVPVDDPIKGQMPIAFITARDNPPDQSEIQDFVKTHAAKYLYPRRVWTLEQMPLGSTAKIDRKQLIERARQLIEREAISTKASALEMGSES